MDNNKNENNKKAPEKEFTLTITEEEDNVMVYDFVHKGKGFTPDRTLALFKTEKNGPIDEIFKNFLSRILGTQEITDTIVLEDEQTSRISLCMFLFILLADNISTSEASLKGITNVLCMMSLEEMQYWHVLITETGTGFDNRALRALSILLTGIDLKYGNKFKATSMSEVLGL